MTVGRTTAPSGCRRSHSPMCFRRRVALLCHQLCLAEPLLCGRMLLLENSSTTPRWLRWAAMVVCEHLYILRLPRGLTVACVTPGIRASSVDLVSRLQQPVMTASGPGCGSAQALQRSAAISMSRWGSGILAVCLFFILHSNEASRTLRLVSARAGVTSNADVNVNIDADADA